MWSCIFMIFLVLVKRPKKRNFLIGYKTRNALKSEKAFQLANKLFYNYLKNLSISLMFIGTVTPFIFSSLDWNATIGMTAFLLGFSYIIVKVERKISTL